MDEITRRGFADPELVAVESAAIELATTRTDAVLAAYAQRADTFGGRYVAADTMKELMPRFAASPESRSRFNGAVHNSAAVLSAEQYRRLIEAGPRDGRDKVYFVTGIPGAGKSSSIVFYGQQPDVAVVFEGQMSRPGPSMEKIDSALRAGFDVSIVAVHVKPETALDRTNMRFLDPENGRGASIAVMSEIQGNLPSGLRQVQDRFGDSVSLLVLDNSLANKQLHHAGWSSIDVLEREGDREQIRQRLVSALERGYQEGRYSDGFYRQAAGRSPEKEGKGKALAGDGRVDAGRPHKDGGRSSISPGNPEKDALSRQTIQAEAVRHGLILRDGDALGRPVQGEVVAGSSQHVLVRISDMVALSYERDRLERAVSVGERLVIEPGQDRHRVHEQNQAVEKDHGREPGLGR
ncbi:MAG: zeta toxin family protein [Lautropia sp.]|nr:zeta toxin family protein [Lautropia sp.]